MTTKARIYWLKNLRHSYSPYARIGELNLRARHNDVINGEGSCTVEGYIEGHPEKLMGTIQKANGQIALSSEVDYSGMIFVPEKVIK
jgi:hypothetical protein